MIAQDASAFSPGIRDTSDFSPGSVMFAKRGNPALKGAEAGRNI